MNLEQVFRGIKSKMISDFNDISSQIKHRSSKGNIRERELIREFLKIYIPQKLNIGHGEIITTSDETSNECDVIIHDRFSCPYLIHKEDYQVFPIELVYCVIEVKSNLDSLMLEDSFNKIHRIKKFKKTAYRHKESPIVHFTNLYGKKLSVFPTLGLVFAYESIELKTLESKLHDLNSKTEPENRIDSVWVLKKGAILNWSDQSETLDVTPTQETRLRAIESDNILMLLTTQLQRLLLNTWTPDFNLTDYLSQVEYGKFVD